jgi:acyl-CoA thioesterase-2
VSVHDLVEALTLEPKGDGRFAARGTEWWAGDRVFGGMVVAQALRAAQATVDRALPVHSLHGYFLRPVPVGAPVELAVDHVRDGRSFTTRRVTSSVGGKESFTMTCSFHTDEPGDEYQLSMPSVPPPESVARSDVPVPFEVRDLGSTPQRADGTFLATRRVWFRTDGALPDDPTLHAAVVAYLSDMTGAAFRPLSLGSWGTHTDASLDHGLWLHRPARADEWLLYDLQSLVNSGGRSTVRGVMYTRDGRVVASMAQELLIRLLDAPDPQVHPDWPVVHPE